MQAVILAGGLGTRLHPMTESTPKSLLPVKGRPFLEHQIELLKSHGLGPFLLLLGYLGKQVEEHFGSGSRLGVSIAYSYEASPLGTGGALKNAGARLDPEFLLTNGDTYLDIDYRALVAGYHEHPCLGMIVAFDNCGGELASNLAIEKDGTVAAYRKRDARGLTHVDGGAIVLNKLVLDLMPAGAVCSLEEEVYPRMIQQKQLRAWVTGERFIDMGSKDGLAALEARLS